MRTLTVDQLVSLDGFTSRQGEGQQFVFPFFGEELLGFMQAVLERPQTMVVGRVTAETLGAYWMRSKEPQARPMNEHPKLVFSRKRERPLERSNARYAERSLVEELAER